MPVFCIAASMGGHAAVWNSRGVAPKSTSTVVGGGGVFAASSVNLVVSLTTYSAYATFCALGKAFPVAAYSHCPFGEIDTPPGPHIPPPSGPDAPVVYHL